MCDDVLLGIVRYTIRVDPGKGILNFRFLERKGRGRNKKLLGAKGIATRSKKLLGAPGLTISNKKLLETSATLVITSALLVATRSY